MRTVLVLLLTLGTTADAAAQRRAIAIDDQFRFQDVGNPEMSPDGEWSSTPWRPPMSPPIGAIPISGR